MAFDEPDCPAFYLKDEAISKTMNIVAASLFCGALCFGLIILVKYLLLNNNGLQNSMIIFYVIVVIDLTTRVAWFITSCFTDQFNIYLYWIQFFSTLASVGAGVSHS